jgi:hypothetical protein
VSACRSAITGSDRFSLGYCQGFIASKIGRLSEAKKIDLERSRKRAQERSSPLGADPMLDIMAIIRSSRFDDRHFGEFQRRFERPLTAEDVLDHVINDLLYVEEH